MSGRPDYLAYEERYRKVKEAGGGIWGHTPADELLNETLAHWVAENNLAGRRVIEYACGEGSSGVILSRLGCVYHGVDIAPSAVSRAKDALRPFPDAQVTCLDMVNERIGGEFDAALDCMGLHMLVTDCDRRRYLANLAASLKPGAPALFFRESFREDAYSGEVASFDDWKRISSSDYDTPQPREINRTGVVVELPLVPARAKNREDYLREMEEAGLAVDALIGMDLNRQCPFSCTIFTHKR